MKDIRGIEIKAGDMLAVPMRRGSDVWLDTRRVISANPGDALVVQSTYEGSRPRKLGQYSVLIIELPAIS